MRGKNWVLSGKCKPFRVHGSLGKNSREWGVSMWVIREIGVDGKIRVTKERLWVSAGKGEEVA